MKRYYFMCVVTFSECVGMGVMIDNEAYYSDIIDTKSSNHDEIISMAKENTKKIFMSRTDTYNIRYDIITCYETVDSVDCGYEYEYEYEYN